MPGKYVYKAKVKSRTRKGKCNANKNKMAASDQSVTISALTSTPIQNSSLNQPVGITHKVFKPLENKSESKLRHSVLKKFDYRQNLTRSQTEKLGIRKGGKTPAMGNSIMNLKLLSSSIAAAAIRGKCKYPQSKLNLYEHKQSRRGLAQKLSLVCNKCSELTDFMSSERYKLKAHDVNMKTVHASCQGMGHSGLHKFTALADLPKPVNVKPYNVIVKSLRDESIFLSEKTRLDRRKRRSKLKSKTETKAISYMAGVFGLGKHPEIDVNDSNPKEKVVLKDISITFIDDNTIKFMCTS